MKRILFVITIVISLVVINNFIHSISSLWRKHDLIVQAEKTLLKEKEANKMLKKQLAVVQSPNFVEQQARDKLFMVRVGERSVLLPKDLQQASDTPQKQEKPRAVWQQWLSLFF